ncbi:hypothetical protein [Stackebrandtia nassauensis]|uniref:Uncharacterized protein n=1 Tax=Stackebrandtia nassauensis (strain DSM 44728 / CIP 108903 / NRRL B-16338 / NBRC 102104 / LLR-40K-21) TaxID=446470 RepID=D3Q6S7_STANL|nr:hypothetical protein [Stackebrandtia nassauensis]ADD40326.1 hypothetical protein Snas_0612 [Stackebrandtia nassauensis DSM 44728]
MTSPDFDPRRDAEPAVRSGWLRPGERLAWTRHTPTITFQVPGRGYRGKVLKQSPWRTAGRRALAVADGAVTVLDFFASDVSSGPSRPEVRVFGTRTGCRAATLAEANAPRSFWVLTDQRFAHLRADDGALHTIGEIPSDEFGYSEFTHKRLTYERIVFGDGSGIDFRR